MGAIFEKVSEVRVCLIYGNGNGCPRKKIQDDLTWISKVHQRKTTDVISKFHFCPLGKKVHLVKMLLLLILLINTNALL